MSQNLNTLSAINDMTNADFDMFRSALKTLMTKTFIIRGIEKERELYDFTIRNISLFESWFYCMDAEIVRDESRGVIAFRGTGNMRLHFSREEICAALTLCLLYEEKQHEVTLTAFPVARVEDFKQKYKAACGEEIKKTILNNVLRRLSSCKLIALDAVDGTDNEALIRLYPSIPFMIDRRALDEGMRYLAAKNDANKSDEDDTGDTLDGMADLDIADTDIDVDDIDDTGDDIDDIDSSEDTDDADIIEDTDDIEDNMDYPEADFDNA